MAWDRESLAGVQVQHNRMLGAFSYPRDVTGTHQGVNASPVIYIARDARHLVN